MATSRTSAARRHIAFVTPLYFGEDSYVGGGERYPLNLARGVVAADASVHVDIIALGTPQRRRLQPRLDLHVLPVSDAGAGHFDHVSGEIASVVEPMDLVHVHQLTRPSQLAILAAKFFERPVVATDHGAATPEPGGGIRYLDLVDLLVSYSRFGASRIAGGRRSLTIPGGVDSRFFRPPAGPVDREHLLYAGRLLPHKGVDRLICALPPGVPLLLVGRAYDREYAAYLHALAAGRDVTFVEDADDLTLRDLYRRAWATVLPSVHRDAWGRVYEAPELMGLTALESMACGTPAIVSTAAALPEFVRDGETGFVFTDLAQLTRRIRALVDGHADADELGRRGRAMVDEEYSLEIAGRKLLSAYEQLWEAEVACAS